MKVTIHIETEDNNLSMIHALLADIIAKSARNLPDEIHENVAIRNDNCGFEWTIEIDTEN